jgi:hypothetical protein
MVDFVPVEHDPFNDPPANAANSMANENADIYAFPGKPQRPFSADYPLEPATDASGRLKFDIEGRPLVAPRIVGRRNLGGADQALPPAQHDAIATAATGRLPESVATDQASGTASAGGLQVRRDSQGRQILQIYVNGDLPPEQQPMVVGHEFGHVIDHLAGVPSSDPFWNSIPQSDVMRRELEPVYSAGATGELVPVDHDPFAQ